MFRSIRKGTIIGEFLWFRRENGEVNYSLNDVTVFHQSMAKGVIVKRNWRLFGANYLLIQSLETGDTGRYCEK